MDYNLFRASLITCSTGALASSFKIAVTTFCEGACANPSIVRAATASSCTCALAAVKAGPVMSTAPEAIPQVFILSFKSTITRWAVFKPIPFTVFSKLAFSVLITFINSEGDKAERIMRAVLPPMPDTEISRRNSSRSCLSAKP